MATIDGMFVGEDAVAVAYVGSDVVWTPPDITAPAVPTGLSAVSGNTEVALNWDDNVEGDLDHYDYRVDGGSPVSTALISGVTVTGLTNGVEYDFQVRAVDAVGNASTWSSIVSATPNNVLASDSFTGGDDSDIDGRTTDSALGGIGRVWEHDSGTVQIGIASGQAVDASTGQAVNYGFDVGTGDVYVSAVVVSCTDGNINLCARLNSSLSPANRYDVLINSGVGGGVLALRKTVGGTTFTLGAAQTWSNGDKIGLRVSGTTVELMKNDVAIVTVTDSAVPDTNHWVALRTGLSPTFVVDDFVVEEA